MFDDYSFLTGDQLNELLDRGWTIASDGALLPPGTIEQPKEVEEKSISMPYSKTMEIWVDVDSSKKK